MACALQRAKLSSLTVLYSLSKLALKPFGGSVVILMPRCRMAMGKAGLGLEDSQSLQQGRSMSELSPCICQGPASVKQHRGRWYGLVGYCLVT